DQEWYLVRLAREVTADEGVDRFELVDEAVFEKEIECPVDRRRSRQSGPVLQVVEQVVGLDRDARLGNQFEHAQPDGREAQTALRAHPGDIANEGARVVPMAVRFARFGAWLDHVRRRIAWTGWRFYHQCCAPGFTSCRRCLHP